MVNDLNNLAQFLADESLPVWLKEQLDARREEILRAFQTGRPITLEAPDGESVTISPRPVAAVA
jgi:alpha-D-ribose 1-methylphosphonate 5-triphosphate synthase subunit PhnH